MIQALGVCQCFFVIWKSGSIFSGVMKALFPLHNVQTTLVFNSLTLQHVGWVHLFLAQLQFFFYFLFFILLAYIEFDFIWILLILLSSCAGWSINNLLLKIQLFAFGCNVAYFVILFVCFSTMVLFSLLFCLNRVILSLPQDTCRSASELLNALFLFPSLMWPVDWSGRWCGMSCIGCGLAPGLHLLPAE